MIRFLLFSLIASSTLITSSEASNASTPSQKETAFQPPPQTPDNAMRAWNCHGRNQRNLVDHLAQAGIIQSPAVRQVMNAVDRQYYVPQNPYNDAPQGIGLGQTISAPHMHAHVLEEMLPALLNSPRESLKMLDVGCGSGYLTATLGRWVQPNDSGESILQKTGTVWGIDIYSDLVSLTQQNIQKADSDLLKSNTVHLSVGNGWDGWPDAAPFDAIHVGAAASEFPIQLAQQLALHGVLIVPVGPDGGVQHLYKVVRVKENNSEGTYTPSDFKVTRLLGVRYVPLVQGPESSSQRRP